MRFGRILGVLIQVGLEGDRVPKGLPKVLLGRLVAHAILGLTKEAHCQVVLFHTLPYT